jgi:hypothetical protein
MQEKEPLNSQRAEQVNGPALGVQATDESNHQHLQVLKCNLKKKKFVEFFDTKHLS